MIDYIKPPSREGLTKYPLVKDYKSVLSKSTYQGRENQRAIDVLTALIQSVTDLPYRIVEYLYKNTRIEKTKKKIVNLAMNEGYEVNHINRALKEYVATHPNVSVWWDSKLKDEVYTWIGLSQAECEKVLEGREWFGSLPG